MANQLAQAVKACSQQPFKAEQSAEGRERFIAWKARLEIILSCADLADDAQRAQALCTSLEGPVTLQVSPCPATPAEVYKRVRAYVYAGCSPAFFIIAFYHLRLTDAGLSSAAGHAFERDFRNAHLMLEDNDKPPKRALYGVLLAALPTALAFRLEAQASIRTALEKDDVDAGAFLSVFFPALHNELLVMVPMAAPVAAVAPAAAAIAPPAVAAVVRPPHRTLSHVSPETRCYNCDGYGHLASQCPSPGKRNRGRQGADPSSGASSGRGRGRGHSVSPQ